MGEEVRVRSAEPIEPVSCAFGLMNDPLEFAAGPSNDIGVDPAERRAQLRPIEVAPRRTKIVLRSFQLAASAQERRRRGE